MMYDENCFERWSERMEEDYLSQDHEPETPKCCGYDCENEAIVQIDGDWYCSECALQLEE